MPGAPPPGPPPEDLTPLIRPEIPGYTIAPAIAQQMNLASLGTFHKRRGDQVLFGGPASASEGWGRIFGGSHEQQWDSVIGSLSYDLAPSFDGDFWGFQVGRGIWGRNNEDGSQDRVDLFFVHSEANGDVIGDVLALQRVESGELELKGNSVGVNWLHIGAGGWYLDAIGSLTWLSGHAVSDRGIGAELDGRVALASLEGGYPIPVGRAWRLEPQAQIVWQHINLYDSNDPFTHIGYEDYDGFTGRLGIRLEGDTQLGAFPLQPFLSVDLWHDFPTDSDVIFNDRAVTTDIGGTAMEFRGGLTADITTRISFYGSIGYTESLDDGDLRAVTGNAGLRVRW